jgi:predicted dehydrogenase
LKVKVIGAGSIGNHLSHAARALGWAVDLCDIDEQALERTRDQIYPSRYGRWDESIRLFDCSSAPTGGYDLIFIGTPPDSHVDLALNAVAERPRGILVEKPFCTPDLRGAQGLLDAAQASGVAVFTGYDHVVGEAVEAMGRVVDSGTLGEVQTLDVEFREFWGGIFAAHPWLDGPADTYIGFWRRGGGASGEHSHALNLWQHLAHTTGAGRVTQVQAMMDFVKTDQIDYDKLCIANLVTENGLTGRVVQDVITRPPRKWARIQGFDGSAEWHCGYQRDMDAVFVNGSDNKPTEHLFKKTRPDDFVHELRHIETMLENDPTHSPISIERGLDTMLVLAAAHKSVAEHRTVVIDHSRGYTDAALI